MPIISIEIMKTDERERCNTRFTNKVSVQAVPHPDVFWYRLDGRGTQKNTPKKTEIFSRDHISFPKCIEHQIFLGTAATIGIFWVSLNYPILNFKKTVCPKNVWIRHWEGLQTRFMWYNELRGFSSLFVYWKFRLPRHNIFQ